LWELRHPAAMISNPNPGPASITSYRRFGLFVQQALTTMTHPRQRLATDTMAPALTIEIRTGKAERGDKLTTIRAQLIGSDRCTALGVEASGSAPVLGCAASSSQPATIRRWRSKPTAAAPFACVSDR
jgi:hypothetical protein